MDFKRETTKRNPIYVYTQLMFKFIYIFID